MKNKFKFFGYIKSSMEIRLRFFTGNVTDSFVIGQSLSDTWGGFFASRALIERALCAERLYALCAL